MDFKERQGNIVFLKYPNVECKYIIYVFQVDCFSACSAHVYGNVSEIDWKMWAGALAGKCHKNSVSLEKANEEENR